MHILNIIALAARHSPAPFPMYTAWQEISGWTEFTWHNCVPLWSKFSPAKSRRDHGKLERHSPTRNLTFLLKDIATNSFTMVMMTIKKSGFYSLPLRQATYTSSHSLRSKQQCDGPALNGPSLLRYQKMHKYLGRQKRGKLLINGHGGSDLGRL